MEAGTLLFIQTQWRIKHSDSFPSNHIFFLASKVVCGLCLKKKKEKVTDLLICPPSSSLKVKSGSLNVCCFQVVIRLHSTSPSWAPAMWQAWWQGDKTWILSPGCLWSHRTRTHIRTNVLTRLWLVLQWKANSAVGTGEGERISPGRYGKVLEGRWTLSRSL